MGVPALVLGGDLDIVTKPEASRALASSPQARLKIIDGVNHMGFFERSEIYHNATSAFVETLSDPDTRIGLGEVHGPGPD